MTDEQLANYLHLTPEEAAIVIPKLLQDRRAVYDRMATFEAEFKLWQDGFGPKPRGVLMTFERKLRRADRSRCAEG
jgi:hypothetical protein